MQFDHQNEQWWQQNNRTFKLYVFDCLLSGTNWDWYIVSAANSWSPDYKHRKS